MRLGGVTCGCGFSLHRPKCNTADQVPGAHRLSQRLNTRWDATSTKTSTPNANRFFHMINSKALQDFASVLRGNHSCALCRNFYMGYFNLVRKIKFDDGVVRAARLHLHFQMLSTLSLRRGCGMSKRQDFLGTTVQAPTSTPVPRGPLSPPVQSLGEGSGLANYTRP